VPRDALRLRLAFRLPQLPLGIAKLTPEVLQLGLQLTHLAFNRVDPIGRSGLRLAHRWHQCRSQRDERGAAHEPKAIIKVCGHLDAPSVKRK